MLSNMDDQVITVDDNEVFDEQEAVNELEKVFVNEVVDEHQDVADQIDYQTISTSDANELVVDYEEVPSFESIRPNTSNLNDLYEDEVEDFVEQMMSKNDETVDEKASEIIVQKASEYEEIIDQKASDKEDLVQSILLEESVKLNEKYEEEPKADILIIENEKEIIQEGEEEGEEEEEEMKKEDEKEQEEILNEKNSNENIVKNYKVEEYDDNEDVIVSPQSELSAENNPRKTGEIESTKDEVSEVSV